MESTPNCKAEYISGETGRFPIPATECAAAVGRAPVTNMITIGIMSATTNAVHAVVINAARNSLVHVLVVTT